MIFDIQRCTASELLSRVADTSVHMVLTDPPYFIDGLGDSWDVGQLSRRKATSGTVGGLPSGMRFSTEQGARLQEFMEPLALEMFRVLKPGGFLISFCQGRLYHRMVIAFENAGFEIRDMLAWTRHGQAKAQTQDHHVRRHVRKGLLTQEEGDRIIHNMGGRKTPQLSPMFEPILLAMKPLEGTFIQNWMRHETGLIDPSARLDGRFPATVIAVPKPGKMEKGADNLHVTVKPVALARHLAEVFSAPGQIILDPFLGSGSHGVACIEAGRSFIGSEPVPEYFAVALRRISASGRRRGARSAGEDELLMPLPGQGEDEPRNPCRVR